MLQAMIHRFMQEADRNNRGLLIDEIEEILHEEMIVLFLYHVSRKKSIPAALQDVSIDAYGWADFRKLWTKPAEI